MKTVTKEKLRIEIQEFQQQQLIEADIRKVVEEFKHYKQVNRRFTDRLKEMGYHAYMIKDYSHKLRVSKGIERFKVEIYVYGEDFTWDKIIKELDRCNFKGYEQHRKEKLERFDSDLVELKKLYSTIESMKETLRNFDLWNIEMDLRNVIDNSK